MNGVRALIALSMTGVMSDDDRDVLILDRGVFADDPGGIRRQIQVQFDPTSDILVIYADANTLNGRTTTYGPGEITLGNLIIRLVLPNNWTAATHGEPTINYRED